MQLVLENEVLKWSSVKLSPLELNIYRFSFLYLSIKLFSFYNFYPYLTALIARWKLLKKSCSFSSYDELNFQWTFHCKLSLDWNDQN